MDQSLGKEFKRRRRPRRTATSVKLPSVTALGGLTSPRGLQAKKKRIIEYDSNAIEEIFRGKYRSDEQLQILSTYMKRFLDYQSLMDELTPEEEYEILGAFKIKDFEEGEVIYHEGNVSQTMYFLYRGEIGITNHSLEELDAATIKTKLEEEIEILHKISPGLCFGEVEVINETRRSETIVCLKKCVALTLSKKKFQVVKKSVRKKLKDKKTFLKPLIPSMERLTRVAIDKICACAPSEVFKRHSKITSQDHPGRFIYIVVEGEANLCQYQKFDTSKLDHRHTGEKNSLNVLIAKLKDGSIFGEELLLKRNSTQKYKFTTKVVSDKVKCLRIDIAYLLEQLGAELKDELAQYTLEAHFSRERRGQELAKFARGHDKRMRHSLAEVGLLPKRNAHFELDMPWINKYTSKQLNFKKSKKLNFTPALDGEQLPDMKRAYLKHFGLSAFPETDVLYKRYDDRFSKDNSPARRSNKRRSASVEDDPRGSEVSLLAQHGKNQSLRSLQDSLLFLTGECREPLYSTTFAESPITSRSPVRFRNVEFGQSSERNDAHIRPWRSIDAEKDEKRVNSDEEVGSEDSFTRFPSLKFSQRGAGLTTSLEADETPTAGQAHKKHARDLFNLVNEFKHYEKKEYGNIYYDPKANDKKKNLVSLKEKYGPNTIATVRKTLKTSIRQQMDQRKQMGKFLKLKMMTKN